MVSFLRETADDIERSKMDSHKLKKIFEFYIALKFESEDKKEDENQDEKDFLKFLFLGWYIYTYVLKESF